MDEKRKLRINELTFRLTEGTITPEELAELNEFLDSDPVHRRRFEQRTAAENIWKALADMKEGELMRDKRRKELAQYFSEGAPSIAPQRRHRWQWYAVSAAAVLFMATALWLITDRRPVHPSTETANKPYIPPGGNKAILQLSDGSRIDLASATKGAVAQQGNSQVIKQDNGQLSYLHTSGAATAVAYNMVFTPKGGTYRVTLSDNTIVWLNAESSLRFPTSFTGTERQVEVTGEAYFEVAKNKAMPFIVKTDNSSIRVLGTHFDVRAYPDEPIAHATLLEGSIAVQTDDDRVVLKPGEQAGVTNKISVSNVDTDEAVGWKDGFFVFNQADISTIMREISRWFNVKVIYKGEKTDRKLTGRVSRLTDASSILQVLEANGYNVSISEDAKTITILP